MQTEVSNGVQKLGTHILSQEQNIVSEKIKGVLDVTFKTAVSLKLDCKLIESIKEDYKNAFIEMRLGDKTLQGVDVEFINSCFDQEFEIHLTGQHGHLPE
jgi:hypothetical protein